jgi:hypothetical protein
MDRFVATPGPAGALLEAQGVVRSANEKLAAANLLEVAFQAEVRVANRQQLGVYRTVRRVTDGASFAEGFVFEDIRTALCGMTAKAALVCGSQRGAARPENGAFVRRMAGGATQPPLRHRMMGG